MTTAPPAGAHLQVTSPAPRGAWQELLAADPSAPAFQSPEWLDAVVASSGGTDASRLYELPGGRRLVLPLVRAPRTAGPLAVTASLPYGWGTGGLVRGAEPLDVEDVSAVLADLLARRPLRLSVRPPSRDAAVFDAAVPASAIRTRHCEQVLDLTGGFEQVWTDRFTGKARRAVRKAEASPLEVEHDDTGRLLPEFYGLYQASVLRWAAHQHEPVRLAQWRAERRDPLSKFQVVADKLGPALRVWLARLHGRPAAAVLVLVRGRTATYWRGAMDKELAGPHRANDLLHRLAIEDACAAGCTTYAMGDSGASESLTRFKESFGAVSRDYAGYRFERVPLTAWDAAARGAVKRVIGFRDT